MRRVVVTGMAPVSAIGKDRETFWQSLVRGVSAVHQIARFKERGFQTQIGCEMSDFSPEPFLSKKEAKRLSRFTQLSVVATQLALADAHLETDLNAQHAGIIYATGIGGLEVVEEQVILLQEDKLTRLNPLAANTAVPNAAAAFLSVYLKLNGPHFTVSTGCSSSGNALALAYDQIQLGRLDVVITGGSETPLTDVIFGTFDVSHQMSTKNATPEKAVSPFDLNRDGFVLGEGAATLILEEYEHARKRGAHIYGELIGYGQSSDAYDAYQMEQEGKGMALAIEKALLSANLSPYEVDYICAHGSGSKNGDRKETNAIKKVFRERAREIPISTIKDKMGMPFGASTAFQAIATLLMLEKQQVIPTINYETPDPECDLNYVPNEARATILNKTLINSMGIGGNNVVLAFSKMNE